MNELPLDIQRSVRRYEPINSNGLILYPVLVSEYEDFLIARPALEVLHQSLPVAFLRMPLLSALYQIDYDAVVKGMQPTGLFSRARLALALALRLGAGKKIAERIETLRVVVDRRNPQKLLGLRFTKAKSGEEVTISPASYRELRAIIAAQNGVRIESDKANPNIVQAQKDLQAANASIDANIDDWLSALAALTGTDESAIEKWPILKLEKRTETYRRILDYLVCGIGETNGATWKGGNPVPHPFFRRIRDGNGLFSPLGSAVDKETTEAKSANTPSAVQQLVVQSQSL